MRANSRPANLYASYTIRFVAQKEVYTKASLAYPKAKEREFVLSLRAPSPSLPRFAIALSTMALHSKKKSAALTLIFVQVVCPKSARS